MGRFRFLGRRGSVGVHGSNQGGRGTKVEGPGGRQAREEQAEWSAASEACWRAVLQRFTKRIRLRDGGRRQAVDQVPSPDGLAQSVPTSLRAFHYGRCRILRQGRQRPVNGRGAGGRLRDSKTLQSLHHHHPPSLASLRNGPTRQAGKSLPPGTFDTSSGCLSSALPPSPADVRRPINCQLKQQKVFRSRRRTLPRLSAGVLDLPPARHCTSSHPPNPLSLILFRSTFVKIPRGRRIRHLGLFLPYVRLLTNRNLGRSRLALKPRLTARHPRPLLARQPNERGRAVRGRDPVRSVSC